MKRFALLATFGTVKSFQVYDDLAYDGLTVFKVKSVFKSNKLAT